jgi:hypothetical protein
MGSNGYDYASADLAMLLLRSAFNEKTEKQSAVIKDYLLAHGTEFDRFSFNVRVGQGITPDPSHPIAIQKQAVLNTQKRIDLLVWRGRQPVIIEAKSRVDPSCLGQILTYRDLWLEDNPDAPEPELVVIGRTSDDDTIRALNARGVVVFLYAETPAQ